MYQSDVTELQSNLAYTPSTILSKSYPWIVWGLAAAFFLTEYFARIAPGIMVPELMAAFHVNALSLGSLSAIFYIAYLGMQMPVGSLVDRYGAHRLLTIAALLCAAGCVLFAGSHHLLLAKIGRFLMGFGASFAFVSSLKLATNWFSPTRFGLLSGLTQALGMVGAAAAAGPLALVAHSVGWRNTMWLIALVICVLAVLIGLIVRDQPRSYQQKAKSATLVSGKIGFIESFRIILRNKQNWLNSLYIGLTYAPTAGFAELWGTSYLSKVYTIDRTVAANAISCIFLGLALGCPVAGWVSDKIKRRKPVMFFAAFFSLILMATALYVPHLSVMTIFVLLFFYGLCNAGFATSYAVASELNSKEVTGTSLGFANLASVVIGACFQPIIGWFLDLQWDGKMIDGVQSYSIEAYRHAMMAFPICLAFAFFTVFLIKETNCKMVSHYK